MGISRDSKHKRRNTGGKRKIHRKKRKYELGRPAAMTRLGTKRIHLVRCRGGMIKHRALKLDHGNFSWASEGIAKKTRVLVVVYNASNNELVRTNTLVKNSIIQIDATPFRSWYEQHYGAVLGKTAKTGASKTASSTDSKGKDAGKSAPAAKGKDSKDVGKDTKAPAKDAKAAPAKKEAAPAKGKNTKAQSKEATPVKDAKAPAKDAKAAPAKDSKAAPAKKEAAKGKDSKDAKKESAAPAKDAKAAPAKDAKAAPAKDAKAKDAKAAPKSKKDSKEKETIAESAVSASKSASLKSKLAARRLAHPALDQALQDQFSSGRLYAAISSRPGQSGRCDGYILEGEELAFYLKKLKK